MKTAMEDRMPSNSGDTEEERKKEKYTEKKKKQMERMSENQEGGDREQNRQDTHKTNPPV